MKVRRDYPPVEPSQIVSKVEFSARHRQYLADILNDARVMTLEQVGWKYGITRERVRQITVKYRPRVPVSTA